MSTKQNDKVKKGEEKVNLFRDSKRRLIYPIMDTNEAYVINPGKEGYIFLYDSRFVFSLFPIALLYGFAKWDLLLCALIGAVVYVIFEVYFHKFYIKKFRKVKLKPEDAALQYQPSVLKSRRTDRILWASMGILVVIIIVNEMVAKYMLGNTDTLQLIASGIVAFVVLIASLYELYDAFKLNKRFKETKASK